MPKPTKEQPLKDIASKAIQEREAPDNQWSRLQKQGEAAAERALIKLGTEGPDKPRRMEAFVRGEPTKEFIDSARQAGYPTEQMQTKAVTPKSGPESYVIPPSAFEMSISKTKPEDPAIAEAKRIREGLSKGQKVPFSESLKRRGNEIAESARPVLESHPIYRAAKWVEETGDNALLEARKRGRQEPNTEKPLIPWMPVGPPRTRYRGRGTEYDAGPSIPILPATGPLLVEQGVRTGSLDPFYAYKKGSEDYENIRHEANQKREARLEMEDQRKRMAAAGIKGSK